MESFAHEAPVRRLETRDGLFGSLAELFSAGQEVLLARIDLLRAELTTDVRQAASGAAVLAGAAAFALIGWTALSAAGGVLLDRWLPLDASLAIVAGVNLLLAAIGIAVGRSRLRHVGDPEVRHG